MSFVRGLQTIIHAGFAIWSIACGCVSTIKPGTPIAALVVYMVLCGIGAGGVCICLQLFLVLRLTNVFRPCVSFE
jgi:hypothetical protein